MVHTEIEPMATMSSVRKAVLAVDRDAYITNIRTMDDVIIDSQAERYFGLRLLTVLSIVGFALAVCGIVATSSHSIARRSNELMIRVACGATPTDVIGLVVAEQLKLVVPALLLAIVVATTLAPSLELSWSDQQIYRGLALFGVPLLLGLVSLLASAIVASRANFSLR